MTDKGEPGTATRPAGPLAGLTVLDLTTIIFGPLTSQILADYGANVIKVETPEGDSTRNTGPTNEPGMAALFLGVNRGKRSVVLDLKLPKSREAILALSERADVFMHSMRPQKLEALGISPHALCERNPRLVYAGLHGFAAGGPYTGRPAYDDIIQGMSGLVALMERQSGEARTCRPSQPTRPAPRSPHMRSWPPSLRASAPGEAGLSRFPCSNRWSRSTWWSICTHNTSSRRSARPAIRAC